MTRIVLALIAFTLASPACSLSTAPEEEQVEKTDAPRGLRVVSIGLRDGALAPDAPARWTSDAPGGPCAPVHDARLRGACEALDVREAKVISGISVLVLSYAADKDPAALATELAALPSVRFAEPEGRMVALPGEDADPSE